MDHGKKYWGKYRGTVVTNVDPLNKGRIKVQVADESGNEETGWAMPCVPLAGPQSGVFYLPAVGARVWIEFEHGDPDYPVWVGGFWDDADELPPPAAAGDKGKPSLVHQSVGGHQFVISDLSGDDGGLLLKAKNGASVRVSDVAITLDNGKGAKVVINDSGITIDNGQGAKVEMQGNTVNVNGGAFTVM